MEKLKSLLSEWSAPVFLGFVVLSVLFLIFSLGGEEINRSIPLKMAVGVIVILAGIAVGLNSIK